MDTSNLMEGLQLFLIGFGGVFLNLVLINVAISLLGWFYREKKHEEPVKDPGS